MSKERQLLESADAEIAKLRAALALETQRRQEAEQALTDAGIVEELSGTLRWVFKPNEREVASYGGTRRVRLAGLLRQVSYLIDGQARKIAAADHARAEAEQRVEQQAERIRALEADLNRLHGAIFSRRDYTAMVARIDHTQERADKAEAHNRALIEALKAVQSQCAGHADEFSQRVWGIASAALAQRLGTERTT